MSFSSLYPAPRRWLHSSISAPVAVRWGERVRSAVNALVDILFTGVMMKMVPDASTLISLLVVSMGTSTVLLFVVSAGSLAQLWSTVGGNLVAATAGVTFALLMDGPVVTSALAIPVVTAGMFALYRTHPPSDAVAPITVIGGPAIHALGHCFVFEPILTQPVLLLVGALVYHAAMGHRCPHAQRLPTAERPSTVAGLTHASIVAALHRQSELFDIDPEDTEAVLHEMQLQAYARTSQAFTCADIMTTPVVTTLAGTSTLRILGLLRQHGFKTLPVVDEGQRVVEIVTRVGLLGLTPADMRQTLHRWLGIGASTPPRAVDHMKARMQTVTANAPMSDLVPTFVNAGHHHTPVLDTDGRLTSIVTGSGLVGGLYHRANIESQVA